MKFDIQGAAAFFNFFGKNGVEWFFIEAQCRKVNGQRGAPLGKFFGQKFATHFSNCPAGFFKLIERLEAAGKERFDLQTRESPSREGARLLLIDDLERHAVNDFLGWWSGPVCIMETSPSNFQALLASPKPLTSTSLFFLQKKLAKMFKGDQGATGPAQLHRLPGSLNNKRSALVNGLPFCTRLTRLIDGEDDASDQLNELLCSAFDGARNVDPDCKKKREENKLSTGDNSSQAFGWAVQQIKKGASDESILAGLRSRYLTHHDFKDWPVRTLHNSYFSLGLRQTKYQS